MSLENLLCLVGSSSWPGKVALITRLSLSFAQFSFIFVPESHSFNSKTLIHRVSSINCLCHSGKTSRYSTDGALKNSEKFYKAAQIVILIGKLNPTSSNEYFSTVERAP